MCKCALCEEASSLCDSHIIPKLIYNRTKSYRNSRFRNYNNLNEIFQDGEKKPLLCQSCEKFFCIFESEFANKYLDLYLAKPKYLPEPFENIDAYIISVSWRILFDDLYLLDSYDGIFRELFERLERDLRISLINLKNEKLVG